MRLLVTGGAGFIGSALVRLLIRETGHEVLNLDKLTYAGDLANLAEAALSPRHCHVQADILDAGAVRDLLAEFRPDVVVHLAAESHVDRSIDGPRPFIETNITGTYTLLEAARDYWGRLGDAERARFRFHYVSTDEVFGSLGAEGRFDEASPLRPSSPYAASKAAGDHLVHAWHRTYGLPIVISHASNTYGPYQFPDKLIPLLSLNALQGRALPIYGDGRHVRDWLHVEDHARALLLVATQGRAGESYGIAGEAERRNRDVALSICALMDELRPASPHVPHCDLIASVADRPGHDRRYALDAGKLRRELGWAPRYGFEVGLRATVRWYLDNERWWATCRQAYSGERLSAPVADS